MIRQDETILSAQEEAQLASRIRQGDKQARELLILANLRLVVHVAKRFLYSLMPAFAFDDLVQEGYIGLIRAVEKFDPSRGRFSSCAVWWISQAMREASLKSSCIVFPHHILPLVRALQESDGTPEDEMLVQACEQYHISREQVAQLRLVVQPVRSLDITLVHDDETTYTDMLLDERAQDAFEQVVVRSQVEMLLRYLSPREREIVTLAYGLTSADGIGMTFTDVCRTVGLSRFSVERHHKNALSKMRDWGPQDE